MAGSELRRMSLEEALPHQLRRAGQAWSALWHQRVPELTSPQFAVLVVLFHHAELDQSALGSLASVDRSTLTVLVDRLEADGLLTKTADPANRRRRLIALTSRGRDRLERAAEEALLLHGELGDLFGEPDLQRLIALLRRLGDVLPAVARTPD
ncbi:MarR family transcriptional regulator [Streptomyces sp. NPDC048416]|uniref:MarR family transcriptional regulator n=1 Tax=Streptomyces sp. NPDC048416 TaxID=3365546 RepID=UPI003711E120